jgi:hypothetical protein
MFAGVCFVGQHMLSVSHLDVAIAPAWGFSDGVVLATVSS